jgi:hypothetical protein
MAPNALPPHAVPIALPPKSKTGGPIASWWQSWHGAGNALGRHWTWAAMHQMSSIHKSSIDRGKSACQNYQIQHCQIWQLHWRQNTLHDNIKNLALPNASNYTGGKAPYIKHPAVTNLAFTGASHLAKITKCGNSKFCQLHWRQNIMLKLSKIRH